MNGPRHQGSTSVELVVLAPVFLLLALLVAGAGAQVDTAATARLAADHGARSASMVSRFAMSETGRRAAGDVVSARATACGDPSIDVDVGATTVRVEVRCMVEGRVVRVSSSEVIDRFRSES